MEKFISIRQKFITSVMTMMTVIFLVVLAVITGMNISTANANLKKSEESIKSSLYARGKILVKNNSIALKGLVSDNAFTDVIELVVSTVKSDDDIIRGIYMDDKRVPWVYASVTNPEGSLESMDPLTDEIDLWADSLKEDIVQLKKFKSSSLDKTGNDIIEFVAPVIYEGTLLGHIRYSFSTSSMITSLEETRKDAATARNYMIFTLVFIMAVALSIAYFLVMSLATKITKPIGSLVQSAKLIAQGDYSIEVIPESNDEIGKLAVDFDDMRKTIKKYTEHLQDLIDEKMQQVKDILNNIDQGLFTVNFDGTINEEYSARANEILKVGDVSNHNVYELLRLEERSRSAFDSWINLVRKKHAKQRWKKLEKLAPIHDMEFSGMSGTNQLEYVSVSYQKIYDKNGDLSKLMILTMDETEKRIKEQMMKEERIQHENEMKTILGIANTPEDDLLSFMEDSENRLKRIHDEVIRHLEGVKQQRELHPDEEYAYELNIEDIEALYRDIHTIKGNGGSYGFDLLSEHAHRAEDALEELKKPLNSRRDDSLTIIDQNLMEMDKLLHEIRSKMTLIYGDEDSVFVRVPEENIEYVQRLSNSIANLYSSDNVVAELLKATDMLSWKPLKTLARKFQKVATTSSTKLGKNVEFVFANDTKLYPSDIFKDMDEILLHIIRNAVDHGIEDNDTRNELQKGTGKVVLDVNFDNSKRIVTVQDNGKGMDTEIIAQKAVEKGIVSEDEVQTMSENEKLELIFSSGFSTASAVSEISGRGVGMDIVKTKIEEMDGVIEIASVVNEGTTFTVTMPL